MKATTSGVMCRINARAEAVDEMFERMAVDGLHLCALGSKGFHC